MKLILDLCCIFQGSLNDSDCRWSGNCRWWNSGSSSSASGYWSCGIHSRWYCCQQLSGRDDVLSRCCQWRWSGRWKYGRRASVCWSSRTWSDWNRCCRFGWGRCDRGCQFFGCSSSNLKCNVQRYQYVPCNNQLDSGMCCRPTNTRLNLKSCFSSGFLSTNMWTIIIYPHFPFNLFLDLHAHIRIEPCWQDIAMSPVVEYKYYN